MQKNQLQFSVVREDPAIELALVRKFSLKSAILVGSGGCTAFALAGQYPKVSISLIEPNPAQIKLIEEKARVLKSATKRVREEKFGLARTRSLDATLIEKGNFEALFRCLRNFLHEFVVDDASIEKLLLNGTNKEWKAIFAHPYWLSAFELFFSESILLAMFGPAAIQHAPRESYSRHFRVAFEKGILRNDRHSNYFLHHLLLGRYPKNRAGWPLFLQRPPKEIRIEMHHCLANEVGDYAPYDLVGLSNIFDWSSEQEIRSVASKLAHQLQPGAIVLYRQLNNAKNFRPFFGRKFHWLTNEAKALQKKDRSLFYSSIQIGRKGK